MLHRTCFLESRPHCVPIAPRLFEWESNGSRLSRLQVPLRLRYAMTIHKSRGQTLPKVVIDLGKSEKAPGCSFVAASRVRSLDHALFKPVSLERLQPKSKCKGLRCRLEEDRRLHWLAQETHKKVGQQNSGEEASTASDDHQESPNPDQGRWDTVCEHLLTPGRIQDVTQIVQAERATIYQVLQQVRGLAANQAKASVNYQSYCGVWYGTGQTFQRGKIHSESLKLYQSLCSDIVFAIIHGTVTFKHAQLSSVQYVKFCLDVFSFLQSCSRSGSLQGNLEKLCCHKQS